MPAFLYQKENKGNQLVYNRIKEISLGGRQVIYKNWLNQNKIFGGWQLNKQDILNNIDNNKKYLSSNYTILIDGKPNSKLELEFYEIQKIHIFTYENNLSKKADWSVLLLKCQLLYSLVDENKIIDIRQTNSFIPQDYEVTPVSTFLYLRGCDAGWNWGTLGRMNVAWLFPDALEYLKKYL